jgi:hypothetical protein
MPFVRRGFGIAAGIFERSKFDCALGWREAVLIKVNDQGKAKPVAEMAELRRVAKGQQKLVISGR